MTASCLGQWWQLDSAVFPRGFGLAFGELPGVPLQPLTCRTAMPSGFLPLLRRSLARRLTSALLLASWAFAVVPIPVAPVASLHKDRSRPFPCMDRACGCQSAEACWKGCCCFTDREKLAWAAAHDVVVPDYVVAAAARETALATPQVGSCCTHRSAAHREGAAVACDHGPGAEQAHAASCGSCAAESAVARAPTSRETAPDYVLGVLMQRCRGQSPAWHSLPPCVIPAVTDLDLALEVVCTLHVASAAPPATLAPRPAEPPPRDVALFLTAV